MRAGLVPLALVLALAPVAAEGPAPLDTPEGRDAWTERVLLEGTIRHVEEIGVGITGPLRVTLELDGKTYQAAFKSLHKVNRGVTHLPGKPPQVHFTDSYRHERAAYLLDRQLGLRMVPVAVLRRVDGKEGALVRWVSDALTEQELRDQRRPQTEAMSRQRYVMELFDALIDNIDRNTGNSLYALEGGRLYLIDHGRSFGVSKDLPEYFTGHVARLPRELLPRLEALDGQELQELLKGLVSKSRVKALLVRRDRILEKIEADRKEYGDDLVFAVEE
jgi:hypothetical protein